MAPGSKIVSPENHNCNICDYKRAMVNKLKGVKIPDGPGKCTKPGGLCPAKVAFDKGLI